VFVLTREEGEGQRDRGLRRAKTREAGRDRVDSGSADGHLEKEENDPEHKGRTKMRSERRDRTAAAWWWLCVGRCCPRTLDEGVEERKDERERQ